MSVIDCETLEVFLETSSILLAEDAAIDRAATTGHCVIISESTETK
jgi:hypothetical protein